MPDAEAYRLIRSWSRKGDAEAALIAGAFVEDRLGFAIKLYFVKLPTTGNTETLLTETALFDGYGPLASFFAKIDLGCALGLYGAKQRMELHVIRSIRNSFAHTLEPATFADSAIEDKLKKLSFFGTLDVWQQAALSKSAKSINKKFFISACACFSGYFMGAVRGRATVEVVRLGS
jgi:hypothetical protein